MHGQASEGNKRVALLLLRPQDFINGPMTITAGSYQQTLLLVAIQER